MRIANVNNHLLMIASCAAATSCGITGPQYPDVAGTYDGPLTWQIPGESIAGQMNLTVVQADDQLTITGSATILGSTIQLPAITGTVNETGFFTATAGGAAGTVSDPNCGTITTTSATLNFTGDSARYHETATTSWCGAWAFDATLTRQ